jgi:hypothetical protein
MTVETPAFVRTAILVLVATLGFVGYRAWLLARASWVEGRVQQVDVEPVRCGARRLRTTCFDFHAVVLYQVDGTSYRTTEPAGRASRAEWKITDASLKAGDPVWVAFDADDPADNYQAGWSVVPLPALLLLAGGAVLLAVGVWGVPERKRYSREDERPTTLGLSGRGPTG